VRSWFDLLRRAVTAFSEDHALRLAASVAYAALFALAPLLIVLIALAGTILGPANHGHAHRIAQDAILGPVRSVAGEGAARSVGDLVSAAFGRPREGFIAQLIGWAAFAFGASALFAACQDALNSIWHVEAIRGGWKRLVRDRVISFALVAVMGILLIASLIANSATTYLVEHFNEAALLGGGARLLSGASWLISFAVLAIAFALMYKALPDVDVHWRDVWQGGALTAALFVVGQLAIGAYFTIAAVSTAYGAAGSLLVLLTWLYYSAVVVLFGAECTKIQARDVHTSVAASLRRAVERPAGVDPREPDA